MRGRDVDDDRASSRKALKEGVQLSRVGNELGHTSVFGFGVLLFSYLVRFIMIFAFI
jgi:hypothetical protein